MAENLPIAVIGGGGYVAGEVVRLIAIHPRLILAAVSSASNIGASIAEVFPHLVGVSPELKMCSTEELINAAIAGRFSGIVSALPHNESEPVLSRLLSGSPGLPIVDLAADMRFTPGWTTSVPELITGPIGTSVAHPGCFATCTTLAAAPRVTAGWGIDELTAFGVTGSTGSGRTPKSTTHHPERHSGFWAYAPLRHRHASEITRMLGDIGPPVRLAFIPHSAPFARGMHVTLSARCPRTKNKIEIVERYMDFYKDCPLVTVRNDFPSVKDVVGSSRCHIGVDSEGGQVAVVCVIDNLIKGAAGGGIQFLNRMLGLPETMGLDGPALGWN